MSNNQLNPTKDPRGLVQRDLEELRKTFKRRDYSPKHSVEEIMFMEGQQSVLRYIEDKMVK